MGTRSVLALLFVAAVGATALVLWLAGGEAPRGPVEVTVRSAETGPVEPAAPAELAPVEAPRSNPGRSLVAEPEAVAPAGAEAVPAPAARGRTVTGRVVDERGAPVAGAQVLCAAGNAFLGLDVELPFQPSGRLRTETDAQGRFTLEATPEGVLSFAVRAPGHVPLRRDRVALPPGDAALADFVLRPAAILTGHVVDPAGVGVGGAEIVALDTSSGNRIVGLPTRPQAETAPDGSFRVDTLAPGAYRLLVRTEAYPDLFVEGLAENPGQVVSGLVWRLSPGAEIRGRVVDVPSDERGRLEVRATQVEDDGFATFLRGRSADVSADGSFRLRGLTPETRYELTARRGGETPGFFGRSRSERVQATAGEVGVVLRYQPEGALTFQVRDADTSLPVTEFLVEAGVDWARSLRDDDGRVVGHHPDGIVRFGGLRPASSEDRVQLAVTAPGYAEYRRDDIALRMGQELDLGTVFLEPVPLVRVTVRTSDGVPIEGARVRLEKDMGDRLEVRRTVEVTADGRHDSVHVGDGRSARTDEDGVAELSSYPGETCKLTVRADGFAPAEKRDLRLPREGVHEETLVLSQGGSVVVLAVDSNGVPLPGAEVSHREPGSADLRGRMFFGGHGTPVTDAEGRVVFENLRPGVHGFQLREGPGDSMFVSGGGEVAFHLGGPGGDDPDWTEVQVVEGGVAEVFLTAPPRGTLFGEVLESGRPLAGASLRLREKKEGADRSPMAMAFGGMGDGVSEKSDGKGGFEFSDVKVGTYTLEVSHPTRRMSDEFEVEVLEGRNLLDLDLPVSVIEGRITDEAGEPLPGVRVRAERARDEGAPVRQAVAIMVTDDGDGAVVSDGGAPLGDVVRTDADGRYRLRAVMPEVELVVRAEGEGVQPGTSRQVRLDPNQVLDGVDLQLQAGGSIRVQALLADGAPARFCLVSATWLGKEEGVEPRREFLQSGEVTLDGLKPGRWRVSAQRVGPSAGGSENPEQEVVVRAGETAEAPLRFP